MYLSWYTFHFLRTLCAYDPSLLIHLFLCWLVCLAYFFSSLSLFLFFNQLRMKCGLACVITAYCSLWMWTKEKFGDNSINTLRTQHMHSWFFDLSQPNEWRPKIIHLHQRSIHIDLFISALFSFEILVCGSNIVSSPSAFIILIINMYEMVLFVFISFVFDVSKTRKW